ncbi:MAG: patatin-like phospholipase family protein [bacterium]|nr:patatin-like phospholipase family protein [bacterium]
MPPTLPFCDIIMKGGITSGVVYPHAVLELSRKHRFKSIGGTSAGAIAASLTAAAEYNREHGGFEELEAATARVGSSLFGLFQPAAPFRGVFEVLMAALDRSRGPSGRTARVLKSLIGNHAGQTFAGLAPGAALLLWAALAHRGPEAWALGALTLVLGVLAAWLVALTKPLLCDLPKYGYGLCPGLGEDTSRPALTTWLCDTLDEVAGHKRRGEPATGEPLTFGHLMGPDPAFPTLNLQIMTTDLTTGRPHRVPFVDGEFMFSESAFRRLFPGRIVDHLVKYGHPYGSDDPDLHWLPATDRLPVAVAVRLSLSFPVLLSAVPLVARDWTLRDEFEREQPRICWFSDGGICSNFPIHFFDALWPRWPTYGIMLDDFDPERHRRQVWMPQTAAQGRLGPFRAITSLPGFLGAIVGTMQNWRDNQQCRLPGYRERIVRVALRPDEGGLNLNMPPATIRRLFDLGREAGERINTDFDFDAHRWRRYLASQEPLDEMFAHMHGAWTDAAPSRRALRDFLPDYAMDPREYGEISQQRLRRMFTATQAIIDATDDWGDPLRQERSGLPRPRGALRMVPPV